jgi:hypothetical protein
MSVIIFCGCGKSDNNRPASKVISSFEISSVSTAEPEAQTSSKSPKKADAKILVALKLDGHSFKMALERSDFSEGQQSYLGENAQYFCDLQARCLNSTCEQFALGITVRFSGGTVEEVANFRQVFAKIDLNSSNLNEVLLRSGNASPATVDDYIAGSLK